MGQQAPQPQELGLRPLQHGEKIIAGGALIAIKLRRLRLQQQRERRLRQKHVRLAREPPRLLRLARGHCDHTLGQRPVPLAPPPLAPRSEEHAGRADQDA